jgi:hypothetical protein
MTNTIGVAGDTRDVLEYVLSIVAIVIMLFLLNHSASDSIATRCGVRIPRTGDRVVPDAVYGLIPRTGNSHHC